jgi:hypothetical protein
MLNLKLTNFVLEGLVSNGDWLSIDSGLGEEITKVNIKALEKCNSCSGADSVINTFELDLSSSSTYYTIVNDVVTINPQAWLQAADMKEGIYSLKVEIDVNDGADAVSNYYSYYVCSFVEGTIPCKIAKKVQNNLYNSELVPLYNAVKLALDCENCCTACNILTYLKQKINECRDC